MRTAFAHILPLFPKPILPITKYDIEEFFDYFLRGFGLNHMGHLSGTGRIFNGRNSPRKLLSAWDKFPLRLTHQNEKFYDRTIFNVTPVKEMH